MKSCIEWRKNFPYLDQVDEYNIDFKNKTTELLFFLDNYALIDKRVNIVLDKPTQDDIELILAIKERNSEYKIAVCLDPDMYYIDMLKEKGIPFYLKTHINSWDALYYAIDLGVSDIFITEEMGFDLKRIKKKLDGTGIQIRCYANISQIQYPYANNDGLKGFYIRPEDVDIYSDYVDVLEFYKSADQQKVLYEVYFKDKKWDGPLKEIIKGLKNNVDNYYILGSEFATTRVECRKKCLAENRCHMCDVVVSLADTLRDSPDYEVFRLYNKEKKNGEGSLSERTDIPEDAGNV